MIATLLCNWMEFGVFDAMEKQYLVRKIIESNLKNLLEYNDANTGYNRLWDTCQK